MIQDHNLLKKIIAVVIMTSSIWIYLFTTTQFFHHDISLEIPYTSHNKASWLISFADGEVHKSNQNFLISNAVNKGFTHIISYNKNDIDKTYYDKHSHILKQQRGAGYWLWKPYLIKKTLQMINDGEFLFYIDSGNSLVQNNVDFFIDKLNEAKADILLFKNYYTNAQFIKRDTYKLMNIEEDKYKDLYHLGAFVIILRKSNRSIEFIDQWLKYCENPQLITDVPSEIKNNPNFKDHRHDQAILTLLYYKDPRSTLVLDYYDKKIHSSFLHHRRRFMNRPIK